MYAPSNGGRSAASEYLGLGPNSDSRPKQICLGMGHCRACLFPIDRETDTLVAVTPDDRVSTVFRRNPKTSYPRIFSDDSRSMRLLSCANDYCKHLDGFAAAIHAGCARMATRLGSPLKEYRHCTEYSFQPTKEHQRRRRDCIRNLIENSLRQTFGKLPPELWKIVSDNDDLIKLYTLAEMSFKRRQPYWFIDFTLPIWATYTTIDGVEYVTSVSNVSTTTKARPICQDIRANTVLYISSDHLGIRQTLTDPGRAILDDYHPAYWQTVSVGSQPLRFTEDCFTGDGYRLRKMVRGPSAQRPIYWPSPVFWPSPVLPTPLALFFPGWGEGEIVARMRPLTFNEPDTRGYSICWAGTEMDAIQAHSDTGECNRGSSLTSRERFEYEEMGDSKWTYHPMAQDEYVKQVWLRDCIQYDTIEELPYLTDRFHYHISTPWGTQTYKGMARNKRHSDMALALVTSKGRTILAGHNPDHGFSPPNSAKREWRLVSETETHAPMTIFVALPTHGIPLFAAPKLSGTAQKSPPVQAPLGRRPNSNPLYALHYSSASLENVTSVTVCRSKNARDEGIIRHFDFDNSSFDERKYEKVAGLLFQYADGHEESVGCSRFDWVEEPLDTRDTKGLFVGTKPGLINQIQDHVGDVMVQRPKGKTELTWKGVPWNGTLEWWFHPETLDTSITHVDRSESD